MGKPPHIRLVSSNSPDNPNVRLAKLQTEYDNASARGDEAERKKILAEVLDLRIERQRAGIENIHASGGTSEGRRV